MKILITEDQLKNIVVPFFNEESYKLYKIKENWDKLNDKEKELVVELYKILHPEVKNVLTEGFMDWIQTGLDVVGMIPGVGDVADIINAVLYFKKGDVFFGLLSIVSLIPFVGDAIAGPIILTAKAAGKEMKFFKAAVATKNAAKIAGAAKSLEKSGSIGKKIIKFIESFGSGLGKKIMSMIEKSKKIPIVGKFFSLIEDWVKVFEKASGEMKVVGKVNRGAGGKFISGAQRADWSNVFNKIFRKGGKTADANIFRDLAKNKDKVKVLGKELFSTSTNKKLLFRTKLFGRFLDKMGLGNFVGSDEEIEQQIPNVENKFTDFLSTSDGIDALSQEALTLN